MNGGSNLRDPRCKVTCVGNPMRGDDGAGPAVAELLRGHRLPGIEISVHSGETMDLLEAWAGAHEVYLVDAVSSGAPPGYIHRFELDSDELPRGWQSACSTHGMGLAEAIELGRALRKLPRRLIVYGIEVGQLDHGAPLSEPVEAAVQQVAEAIRQDLETGG